MLFVLICPQNISISFYKNLAITSPLERVIYEEDCKDIAILKGLWKRKHSGYAATNPNISK